MTRSDFSAFLLVGIWLGLTAAGAEAQTPDYQRDVRPLFARTCFACHGPDEAAREADLRLDRDDGWFSAAEEGDPIMVVRGDPAASELLIRIKEADPEERMPPPEAHQTLSPEEIATIEAWIKAGAQTAPHWSLVAPTRPTLPAKFSSKFAIDAFILKDLEEAGLSPSKEADRYTLARRAAFDLTGLPCDPDLAGAFAKDERPEAWSLFLDELLKSPHYGERWAQVWLDLARYADSAGYGSDPLRTIWRYRDWVIEALNANKPYDVFGTEQLAGDLLPGATLDQRLATAFHRNTMTNTEGGTDDEEFRVAAVRDRVETTSQVFMGMTMACARCHDHKFDPFSQREYFELFDFFNHTHDSDHIDERPRIVTPTRDEAREMAAIDAEIKRLEVRLAEPEATLDAELIAWLKRRAGGIRFDPAPGVFEEGQAVYAGIPSPSEGPVRGVALELDAALPESLAELSSDLIAFRKLFAVELEPQEPRRVQARYVRVSLEGDRRFLSLAEVECLSEGVNIAPEGRARQTSVGFGGDAKRAIDGNRDGRHEQGSVTHTIAETNPFWELDLGADRPIEALRIFNRAELGSRLLGAEVTLRDSEGVIVFRGRIKDRKQGIDAFHFDVVRGPSEVKIRRLSRSERALRCELEPTPFARAEDRWRVSFPWVIAEGADVKASLPRVATTAVAGSADLPEDVEAARTESASEIPQKLREFFRREISDGAEQIRREIAKQKTKRRAIRPVETPVILELGPKHRRKTHVHRAGNFLEKGHEVSAGVPDSLHAWPEGAPKDRRGLARWIFAKDNPLTARVAVNRFWARLFGRGLVETEEDFGSQGRPPSHPELLDWLAREFQDEGWDQKKILKTIMMSEAYRRSASVTASNRAADPQNRLLSRGPREKLSAEMVRDQALALSGLLSRKMLGPSVFPYQPEGLWQAAFNQAQRSWVTSRGEDRYRRAVYTFHRRTIPYPSLATFDLPSREICTVRRIRTQTPLQALVTFNDPAFVEMQQAFGRRIIREGGDDDASRVRFALELSLGRPARESQQERLLRYLDLERSSLEDPDEIEKIAGFDKATVDDAAFVLLAGVLLNLEALTVK